MWRVSWDREGGYAVHRQKNHATTTATRNAAVPNVLRSGPKVSATALIKVSMERSVSANIAARVPYGAREKAVLNLVIIMYCLLFE